jgi:galactonate dehydratase
MLHIPNAMIQEVVRGYVDGYYNEVLNEPFLLREGHLQLNGKPGLGMTLREDFLSREGAQVTITTEDDLKRW